MSSNKVGCLLLTYSMTPFHEQPVEFREQCVLKWSDPTKTSLFPAIRGWAIVMLAITRMAWYRGDPPAWQEAVG